MDLRDILIGEQRKSRSGREATQMQADTWIDEYISDANNKTKKIQNAGGTAEVAGSIGGALIQKGLTTFAPALMASNPWLIPFILAGTMYAVKQGAKRGDKWFNSIKNLTDKAVGNENNWEGLSNAASDFKDEWKGTFLSNEASVFMDSIQENWDKKTKTDVLKSFLSGIPQITKMGIPKGTDTTTSAASQFPKGYTEWLSDTSSWTPETFERMGREVEVEDVFTKATPSKTFNPFSSAQSLADSFINKYGGAKEIMERALFDSEGQQRAIAPFYSYWAGPSKSITSQATRVPFIKDYLSSDYQGDYKFNPYKIK